MAQQSVVLVGSGSTVPLPLYHQWAEAFHQHRPDIQLQYLPVGASDGIRQISRNIGDFGAGEVPLTNQELSEAGLIELPVMLIGIVPIYNLPQVHRDLRFSGALLADIFLGRIKTWNAPEIARLNPGVALPELPIQVIHRPPGKGTNYVFTDFLSKTSSRFKMTIGVTASPAWPVGVSADRSSDMTDTVKTTPGSIGYVELQYAERAKLPYGLVLNRAGKFVRGTPAGITAACQAIEAPAWDRFSASLTNAPGDDSFPITGFTWIYLRNRHSDHRRSAALSQFLLWIFADGQSLGERLGYSQLPPPLLDKLRMKTNLL